MTAVKWFHKNETSTFTDLQINRVINILDQFLTSTGLLKNKSLEVKHQHWRKLFKSHSPADFNLKQKKMIGNQPQVSTYSASTLKLSPIPSKYEELIIVVD